MAAMLSAASLWGQAAAGGWKGVDEAVGKGLPKTAIELLGPIQTQALADKKWGEAARAIGRRIQLEGEIQGGNAEESVRRMEAELKTAPAELKPILETLLAHWFWQFYQENSWRFLQRTATSAPPGDDFTTWDLTRLFAEIDRHFKLALSAEAFLKTTPVSAFDGVLSKGTIPDTHRPTLYDFVVHEAIAFCSSGEQAGARPQDAIDLRADEPVYGVVPLFGTAEAFSQGAKIERRAGESSAERALFLFRDLLAFHAPDADRTAFFDADLARLKWASGVAVGDTKAVLYKAALTNLIARLAGHELVSTAELRLAEQLQTERDLVGAHAVAVRGKAAFPKSPGGQGCASLIQEIETPSASIQTEQVWNAPPSGPRPEIRVSYQNTTKVWFRALAFDWKEAAVARREMDDTFIRSLLQRTPALAWSHDLPPATDFRVHTVPFDAPTGLTRGHYLILASHSADFAPKRSPVSMARVWVSDLALVTRTRAGTLEGFVMDALSGEPIAGAQIESWSFSNRGRYEPGAEVRTDELGFFHFDALPVNAAYLLRATSGSDQVASSTELHTNRSYRQPAENPVLLFSDRAIYRPGQTIQYKGICAKVDRAKDDYSLLADLPVVVVLRDPNGKEVARAKHRSNAFGSFAGIFTAPRDRVLGSLTLFAEGYPQGALSVRVEEYKRPKFQLTLDAPAVAPRLGEKVSVTGHAIAFTGAAIDSAKVKWHVVREVRYPDWWGWFRGGPRAGGSQEIGTGDLVTAADGSFTIEFVARPDLSVSESDEPSFQFRISADVTDTAGETRSGQRQVNAGYVALRLGSVIEPWQTTDAPVAVRVESRTLDGEMQASQGVATVYRIQEPATVLRAKLQGGLGRWRRGMVLQEEEEETSEPGDWPLGEQAGRQEFSCRADGIAELKFPLPAGLYRLVLEAKDRAGKPVTARHQIRVLEPKADHLALKLPSMVDAPTWTLQPGETLEAIWGTGYPKGRAFVEIEHRNRMLKRFWTEPGVTQQAIREKVTEELRGGFTVHVTQVRENRAYFHSKPVAVPWRNKELALRWEHFTSRLEPGQKETWTLVVEPGTNSPAGPIMPSELAATLYDASLDQYVHHGWMNRFSFFRWEYSTLQSVFANARESMGHVLGDWPERQSFAGEGYYRVFADGLASIHGSRMRLDRAAPGRGRWSTALPAAAPMAMADMAMAKGAATPASEQPPAPPAEVGAAASPDLNTVVARRALQETAFFFPQLTSDEKGVVRMNFTMPESVTEWRFLAFAHDQSVRSGSIEARTVTAKEIMVQPNPPRFVREGDGIEFTVKVSNQSAARQTGKVRLQFNLAQDSSSADALLGNARPELDFDIPSKESRSFSWKIAVPDGLGFLTYRAVASTGRLSDGEEGLLPVLSRRVLITESMPLPMRGPGTRTFRFTNLLDSARSDTLRNQGLTVQMVSHPVWYAVLALPYLMEFPHECSEQTFNRLYANALARHIAASDAKIARVFEQWRGTPALESPMEKNQELKSVMLEETPWLRQAQSESAARRNVGLLFESNRMDSEVARALGKLREMQHDDGRWPWFSGGPGNDYLTLYIATGFGRLRHLGVAEVQADVALRAWNALDAWVNREYRQALKSSHPEAQHITRSIALYLYGRSFFLKERPLTGAPREAVEYWLGQARKYWVALGDRQSQGHVALALKRWGDLANAQAIVKSLRERSVSNEELGMFWRDTERSWWWYHAPIETQALMIEVFDEVAGDAAAVESCKVWLLKQKQTQDWKTTKATADAVYALLLRGTTGLSSDAVVEVSVGGAKVQPGAAAGGVAATEPGTGFYQQRIAAAAVIPAMGDVQVKKTDQGVSWGSVHWQYLEDLAKVKPYDGTPLKLRKSLHVRKVGPAGPVLTPASGEISVGDELVVRLELRVDRDMEYVHLKDQRGSGTEPVSVLSGYRYQDGLAYYESTRDAATHFFIDYLPKGVYVFEYSSRVQLRGDYQSGVAEFQCLYAPEFNSHSESLRIRVK